MNIYEIFLFSHQNYQNKTETTKSVMSKKKKVVRATRNSTWLNIFNSSEYEYACDKCRKYLDPLSFTKKREGESQCDQIWRSDIGLHCKGRILYINIYIYIYIYIYMLYSKTSLRTKG